VQQDVPPTPDPEAIAQLPDNPKHWSPSQLSVYLSSALRLKGGGSIPAPVAKDIAAFALREKLTGRTFLKLGDENLAAMGVNQLWREALLSASRTLRKKVLKGRIWGFGSPADAESENTTPIKPTKRRIPSTVEEEASLPKTPPSVGYRGGRVRGMIESLERSSGSTGSDEDLENQPLTDERLENELKAAGLWINDDAEVDDDLSGNLSASSSSDNEMVDDHHSRNSSVGSQPPAYTRTGPFDVSEEPSIQELLSQDMPSQGKAHSRREGTFEEAPSWGAMVWEKDADIVGGTAKKITPSDAPRPIKPGVIHGDVQPNILNMFGDSTEGQQSKPPVSEVDAHVLLDAFRLRLEQMEQRLKELELRDQEREKELAALRENEKRRVLEEEQRKQHERRLTIDLSPEPDPYAHVVNTDDESVDIPWPRPIRQPFTPGEAPKTLAISGQNDRVLMEEPESMEDKADKGTSKQSGDHPVNQSGDLIPSELPAYVFLVSFGVCAVVARVLFRRLAGGRRG